MIQNNLLRFFVFVHLALFGLNLAAKDNTESVNTLNLQRPWYIVNDTVMGGISNSRVDYVKADDLVVFSGRLSLENNGGFASTRTPIDSSFFTDAKAICVDLSSSKTRKYQVRLRSSRNIDGIAYVQDVTVKPEAQVFRLALSDFIPRFRGRDLRGYARVPQNISSSDIQQLTFMIADKDTSPFELVISRITRC